MYADDVQAYGVCKPAYTDLLSIQMSSCIKDIADGTKSNQLQLNVNKTKILWRYTTCRQFQIQSTMIHFSLKTLLQKFVFIISVRILTAISPRQHKSRKWHPAIVQYSAIINLQFCNTQEDSKHSELYSTICSEDFSGVFGHAMPRLQ